MDRQLFHSGKAWLALFSILMFLLAIIGGLNSYSPVPFWDMWDGTLNFYLQVSDGNNALWLVQHNEHRILLSRLLFWLDYTVFDGLSYFLIVVNYVLMVFAIFLFWRFSLLQYRTNSDSGLEQHPGNVLYFTLFILAWLSQWMQWENLTWGFQSQFFLAQSLPLAAFYCLTVSVCRDNTRDHTWPYFCAALLLGVLSLFTMANGVLALPLLTLAAIFMRAGWLRAGLLAACTVLGMMLYFGDYQTPSSHSSITYTLRHQPIQLAQYVVLYLGSPFFALAGEGRNGLIAAGFGGSVLVLLSLLRLLIELRARRINPVTLALLGYLLYLGGTAVGTGTGRVVFGLIQAVSLRYTTPALMAWAAILLLYLPILSSLARRYKNAATTALILVCALLLWRQLPALQPQHQKVFDRKIAALALELGVADAQQINHVYDMNAGLMNIADRATTQDLTVFGQYPLQGLRERWWSGRYNTPTDTTSCQGALDSVETIEQEPGALRMNGWIFNQAEENTPSRVIAIDRLGRIVGFALTGLSRPDVEAAVHDSAGLSGFRGYIKPLAPGSEIELYDEESQCALVITLPDSA